VETIFARCNKAQSHWSLFSGTWQKRPRELDHRHCRLYILTLICVKYNFDDLTIFARCNKACISFLLYILKLGLSPEIPTQIDRNLKIQKAPTLCIAVSSQASPLHPWCVQITHVPTDGGDRTKINYDCQNFQQVFTGVPVHIKHVITGVPKICNKISRE